MVKRWAAIILAGVAGIIVAAGIVLAYRGPTTAVNPSKDYSRSQKPAREVLSGTTSQPVAAAPQSATTVSEATTTPTPAPGTAGPDANNTSPAASNSNGTIHASAQGQANGQSVDASKNAKPGMVQGLVDVITNLQL